MKKIALLLMVLSIISCQSDRKYNTVDIRKKYSLELPADMVRAEHLNDSASLQYQNTYKEIYAIVFEKSKTGFKKQIASYPDFKPDLDGFAKFSKTNMENSLSYPDFSEIENTKINGLKARQFSVSGIMEAYHLYYELAFLEGKDRYYEIVIWTEKSKKEATREKMKRIIGSFKETKRRG